MTTRESTPKPNVTVRQARPADEAAVVSFTENTWPDRDTGDYVPRVFADWVETDGDRQRTFVLDVDDGEDVAGICQGVMLSDREGWLQGMRINPEYRGLGVSKPLTNAAFRWCRDRGATVARAMIFSWNVAGLGQAQSVGFEPVTEFRFTHPVPDSDAEHDLQTGADPAAAWSFWIDSSARDHLRGLVMDDEESWALSELPLDRLEAAAADDRLVAVYEDGLAGFTYRDRTFDRTTEAGAVERWALYAIAAWETPAAAEALYREIQRDAAAIGVDRARVLVPERPRWIGDTAAARVSVAAEPDFVVAADLTDPSIGTR
ncbi:MAG: GNAT family N-acetyltransferase [Halobacteriota archaeon]